MAKSLTRKVPLAENITVTTVIGRNGGSFQIPGAGLRVDVPSGAVSAPTVFTATTLSGDMVAYEFGPHGTVFNKPLRMRQDLEGTAWDRIDRDLLQIEVGYSNDRIDLNEDLDVALVSEFLPVSIDITGSELRFDVWHFSGYMVSSGRAGLLQ